MAMYARICATLCHSSELRVLIVFGWADVQSGLGAPRNSAHRGAALNFCRDPRTHNLSYLPSLHIRSDIEKQTKRRWHTGKDRYSSRFPDHRYWKDDSDEGSSRRYHKSDDDDNERKRKRKMKKQEKERRERGGGDERSRSGGYGGPGYGHGDYRPQGSPYSQYQQPPPPPVGGAYGGYGQPQQYSSAQPPYNPSGEHWRGGDYGYGMPSPHPQYDGYNPPPPPRSPGFPPGPGYGYQPSPPPQAGYQPVHAPQPYGHGYQNQYPPPPSPGSYQARYPPPAGPPPPPGTYQAQYPPPTGPPPAQGTYQAQYPPPVIPPPPQSTYTADKLSYESRPQYHTEGVAGSYKPQAHSTAQAATEGPATTFFSGTTTSATSNQGGGSVLDTFAKGLNQALHGYARTLFPATSTYTASGLVAPEATTGHRFESFATVRNGNAAKWYVDGKDYMYALSVALGKAQRSIWILDWWLSPELYLRRPPKLNEQYRLDRMLQAAAARGVRINVIVYKEVTQALSLDSHHTKHALEDLHPNICVFRHPDHLPDRDNVIRDTWSKIKTGNYRIGDGLKGIYGFKDDITLYFAHHEKLCLIDGDIAFMGGLDLCFGRYDTNEHPIADAHPSDPNAVVFPGQDYNNGRFADFQHVDKWEDNAVSRLEISRMGWTDIAMSMMGPAVDDLEAHFIQRWNFIYDSKYDARGIQKYKRLDESTYKGGHGYHRRQFKEKFKENFLEDYYGQPQQQYGRPQEQEGVRIQICRSISAWSHGTVETEHSIANAYIEIISVAKHFVYMENQFFITATDPKQKPILNMIGRAIVDRIIRAHNDAERFRIVVIIPAIPGFAGDLQIDSSLGTRAIMEFQYRAINRDRGYSIYEQLGKAGIDPKEYIRFYNLRSYDRINNAGATAGTESTGVNPGTGAKPGSRGGAYGGSVRGDIYAGYQAPRLASGGQWDSVAKCYMLGGGDIRQVPWDGDPDKEIEAFVSEELYIHSKLLIADDRIVLMGSANLNDRSQLGDHDSEIVCVIEDPTPLPSRMNGRRFTASHFAATLRRQIFRKHLGLIPAQNLHTEDSNMMPVPTPNIYDFDSPEDHLVEDPLSDQFWNFWNQTAKINTDVFAKVFHAVPHDSVTNWKLYDEYWGKHFATPKAKVKKLEGQPEPQAPEKWGHVVRSEFSPGAQGAREVKNILSAVRGTLVEMPLDFLKEEDIAKEGLGLNALTETLYT